MPDKRTRQDRAEYFKGYQEKNRERINQRKRELYTLNREKKLAYCREYYRANHERVRATQNRYRRAHPEYQKKWWDEHKEYKKAYREANKGKIRQQTIAWNKQQRAKLFEMYGHKCSCPCGCSESFEPFLTLGHLLNDGAVDRAENGGYHGVLKKALAKYDPEHYGILCWNCNNGANANGGTCPKIGVRI